MSSFLSALKTSIISMKTMGLLILIFAFSIAIATFIENDYGTNTAKALVYNAKWFEFLLFLLSLNLIGNIFKYKLYKKDKFPIFLFHLSFLVILLGAAVTRFYGYEGIMHIREGQVSNTMLSDNTYIGLKVAKDGKHAQYESPVLFGAGANNDFSSQMTIDGKELDIDLVKYIQNAQKTLKESEDGKPAAMLMVAAEGQQPQNIILQKGENINPLGLTMAFNPNALSEILIYEKDGQPYIEGAANMAVFNMDDNTQKEVPPHTVMPLEKRRLYASGDKQFVLRDYVKKGSIEYVSGKNTMGRGAADDLLVFDITYDGTKQRLYVFGQKGIIPNYHTADLAGLQVALGYGSKLITLPFSLKLNDFIMSRYPGSMSPSAYQSDIEVIDGSTKFDYSIYMNHILDYKGFRFYQSSFDPDEGGTILSVNHDKLGTLITYAGYIMLSIGMLFSIFLYNGRIMKLALRIKKLKETAALAAFAILLSFGGTQLHADEGVMQDVAERAAAIPLEHAKKFGELLVQDRGGRVKPVETLAFEVLNKIHRKDNFQGLHPDQVFLGMVVAPDAWEKVKIIKISNPELKKLLGLNPDEKYAAFIDFFDSGKNGAYKLANIIEEASQKSPAHQNKLDKEAIKVDERLNIAYLVYTGSLLNIFPLPNDKNKKWYNPIDAIEKFPQTESNEVRQLIYNYFGAIEQGMESGNWKDADKALEAIKKYQNFYGTSLLPPPEKTKAEIFYYNYNIFQILMPIYGLVGLILLIASFVNILKPSFGIKTINFTAKLIFASAFLFHTLALALRWYISGHAPWSDGYESMIYISWATILAGLMLVRNTPLALSASAILTAIILFVAHLSWMDPQITNLVPVLNSYWLTIHVSIITASYGFLGLSALIAVIVLLLMILKGERSRQRIESNVEELTYINEITMTIGLILLTIGNFLGGVWANESWGRYWGWDPKETWALVTILVYAFVAHMRFMKGLYSFYSFNVAAVLAFFSVLMTYFGVNFYLSGLHSYAKGDPVPVPIFVYVMIAVILVLFAAAYKKRKQKAQG